MKEIKITYCFHLPDGSMDTFDLVLDAHTLEMTTKPLENPPLWASLDFHQCQNCPWDKSISEFCPAASNLASIVTRFDNIISYDKIQLEVISSDRTIKQRTTAQRAISSYMGLIMATCGCPHTAFLKPMARFHLPLSNEEETIYRAFSMYALAQYFVEKSGKEADHQFKGLKKAYINLQQVNMAIAKRLKAASSSDSSINALVNLDMYARAMPFVIEESLEELSHLFDSYLKNDIPAPLPL